MKYTSVNEKLKKEFGCKVYKLALSGGMTCPSRDGTLGTRGCIFCSGGGSGEFAQGFDTDIHAQIERAKQKVENKIKGERKYIAYFQSFTNTYAEPRYLEDIFTQAVNHPDIAILSVATRPDCLSEDVLGVLQKMNMIKPVWVELGLQTSNEKSAEYIRRGYKNEVYESAVKNLHRIGVEVITHVILGIPFETEDDMLSTVKYTVDHGTDGIKLQLLHVLKGTDLEKEYLEGKFEVLTMEGYIDIVAKCLKLIPPHVTVHRLTGDGDKRLLIAPLWSGNKKRVLNELNKRISEI